MKSLIFKLFLSTAAVYFASLIANIGVPVSPVAEGFWKAMLVALVLGLINVTIKPIVTLISLPITTFTFGFFTFVINAAMIYLASLIIPWFSIPSLLSAFLFSILLSIMMWILHKFD